MHKLQSANLIEGVYSPQEAREILMDLLEHEINFYKIQNLSSEVRHGGPDTHAQKKIQELLSEKVRILELIRNAADTGKQVNVLSSIHIRMEN